MQYTVDELIEWHELRMNINYRKRKRVVFGPLSKFSCTTSDSSYRIPQVWRLTQPEVGFLPGC